METKGIKYWLDWVDSFRVWVFQSPKGIYTEPSYDVVDISYEDLQAIADHFQERVLPENNEHRQWVRVHIVHGMAQTLFFFMSEKREFTYKELKTTPCQVEN